MSLESRARTIAEADPGEQRQVIEDLKSHLVASVAKGLLQRDIMLTTSTAQRLEDSGQRELAAEVFQSSGEAIRGSIEPRFSELANVWEAAAWQRRGRLCVEAGQSDRAIAHFTKALTLAPNDSELILRRGRLYVRLGQWKQAADDYSRLVAMEPSKEGPWLRAAPLLVLADDLEGYREHCEAMLTRFGQSDEARVAARTCKACLLLPGVIAASEPPLTTLQDALENGSAPNWLARFGYTTEVESNPKSE